MPTCDALSGSYGDRSRFRELPKAKTLHQMLLYAGGLDVDGICAERLSHDSPRQAGPLGRATILAKGVRDLMGARCLFC